MTSLSDLEVLTLPPSGARATDRVFDEEVPRWSGGEREVISVRPEDGRASFRSIADRTGVSHQMARRRAKSLLNSEVAGSGRSSIG